MKRRIFAWMLSVACGIIWTGCSEKDEPKLSPEVPFRMEFNAPDYCVGDSLYGRIVVVEESLTPGMKVKKIDCRLANIVIGSVENAKVCPFGVRLTDTPSGTHTFSVIIKCEAPDCDETYWRNDYEIITIKDVEQ